MNLKMKTVKKITTILALILLLISTIAPGVGYANETVKNIQLFIPENVTVSSIFGEITDEEGRNSHSIESVGESLVIDPSQISAQESYILYLQINLLDEESKNNLFITQENITGEELIKLAESQEKWDVMSDAKPLTIQKPDKLLHYSNNVTINKYQQNRIISENHLLIGKSIKDLEFNVSGYTEDEENYYLYKKVDLSSSSVDLSKEMNDAVEVKYENKDASVERLSLMDNDTKAWYGAEFDYKLFVTPKKYGIFLDTFTTLSGETVNASWSKEGNITGNTMLIVPVLPSEMKFDHFNFQSNKITAGVNIASEGYRLNSISSGIISAKLSILDENDKEIESEMMNEDFNWFNYEIHSNLSSGDYTFKYALLDTTTNKELASTSAVKTIQAHSNQLHGVVITAEDSEGNALEGARVEVYERQNPKEYTVKDGASYTVEQVYSTSIKKDGDKTEAFIPNVYFLQGREYELVVNGEDAEGTKVIYHKSLTAKDMTTIEFTKEQLSKVNVKTEKDLTNSDISLSLVDKDVQSIITWPQFFQGDSVYVSTDQDFLVSAQITDKAEDTGYFYSEIVPLTSEEITFNLDTLDTVEIQAPKGYDQSGINVSTYWSKGEFVSTYYVSKNLYDLYVGAALTLEVKVQKGETEYTFYEYKDEVENYTPSIEGKYDGDTYYYEQGKNLHFDTYFINPQTNVQLEYVGPVRKETTNEVAFKTVDNDGEVKKMAVSDQGDFEEDPLTTEMESKENLLTYQLYKEDQPVGQAASTSNLGTVVIPKPSEEGLYTLALTEQHFPTDVVNVNLEKNIHLSSQQGNQNLELSFKIHPPAFAGKTKLPEYLDVKLYHKETYPGEEESYVYDYYFSSNQGTYFTQQPIRYTDKDEFYLSVSGQFNDDLGYKSFVDVKKLSVNELKALNETGYTISDDLRLLTVKDDTGIDFTQSSIGLDVLMEDGISVHQTVPIMVNGAVSYVPNKTIHSVLNGIGNKGKAYRIDLGESNITKDKVITAEKGELIKVDLEKNGEAIPFKYTLSANHNYRIFDHIGYWFNTPEVVKEFYFTPGLKDLAFGVQDIEENQTPWSYFLWMRDSNLSKDATLEVGTDITGEIGDIQQEKYSGGKIRLTSSITLKSGDFTVEEISPLKEQNTTNRNMRMAPESVQPIREYEGDFTNNWNSVPAVYTIKDDDNKIVYKFEGNYSIDHMNVLVDLVPGKYTLDYQIPTGPSKELKLSKVFTIADENQAFVTITDPQDGLLTNKKQVEIKGETNPDQSVTLQLKKDGKVVKETSVTSNPQGQFTGTLTADSDGSYSVVAVHSEDKEVESNAVTFTIDTTAPKSPANLTVTKVSEGLQVSWDSVEGADTYAVESAVKGESFSTLVNNTKETKALLKEAAPGKTYVFKVTATDKATNTSDAATTEYNVSEFAVTKVEAKADLNSYNLLELGQAVEVILEGAYDKTYEAHAKVYLVTAKGKEEKELTLKYDEENKTYHASFMIEEGTTKITKIEGYLHDTIKDQKTDVKSTEVDLSIGANFLGKVTEGDKALTEAARVRLVGGKVLSFETKTDGTFELKGLPAGEYTIDVVYPLENGKTFRNILNKPVTIKAGETLELDQSLNVPAYRDMKIQFVDNSENRKLITDELSVRIQGPNNYTQYGYINKEGFFVTYSNNKETTLKNLMTGNYQVTVYAQGLYKKTTVDIPLSVDSHYVKEPVKVPVQLLTTDVTDVEISFTNEDIKNIDSISLYSWDVYSEFGYNNVGNYWMDSVEIKDGKIIVPNVAYGEHYSLYVYEEGYRQYSSEDISINDQSKTIEVSLDKGETVTATVKDQDGKAVANADVYAYSDTSYSSVKTNEKGEMELKGLASDEEITLSITAPNYIEYKKVIGKDEEGKLGEITLHKSSTLKGKVVDANEKPIKFAYVNVYEHKEGESIGEYKSWARTGEDGMFYARNLPSGTYDIVVSDYRNPTQNVDSVKTEDDSLIVIMQPKGTGSFTGEGNTLTASKKTVVPGDTIEYRLNYHNNGKAMATNVPLSVTLPESVDVIPETALLNGKPVAWNNGTVTVSEVDEDQTGALTFEAKVKTDTEATVVNTTATINDSEEKKAEIMNATTNILFVTVNAPKQTAAKKIKVYGNAKTGSEVEVYVNSAFATKVKVEGKWWFADVTLPVKNAETEEAFKITAKVKDGAGNVTSSPQTVNYVPTIPQIDDLSVYAGWNGTVHLNPYTGMATFAVVEKTPLDTTVTFKEAVDEAKITFLGKTYDMTSSDNKTFTFDGSTLGEWSSYGEEVLEITFKKGDVEITLPIMEIIVLIDPSGYVFEGSMDTPLEGVTATVEQEVNGKWVKWDAAFFGQINPQITDPEGRYGWDVIKGKWRVVFTKDGYEPYISRVMDVPPPETELNVPMVKSTDPMITSVTPAHSANDVKTDSTLKVTFDRLMSTANMADMVKLYEVNDQDERTEVKGMVETKDVVSGYEAKTLGSETPVGFAGNDSKDESGYFKPLESKKLSKTFEFKPEQALKANTEYVLYVDGEMADYGNKTVGTNAEYSFTTAEGTVTPPPTGGGGGTLPPAPEPTPEPVDGTLALNDLTVSEGNVTIDAEKVMSALEKGRVNVLALHTKGDVDTFDIPAHVVKALQENKNARIEVKDTGAIYRLPVSELKIDQLVQDLKASKASDVTITITMKSSKEADKALTDKGLKILAPAVQFEVTASYNGKSTEVKRFSQYVERELTLAGKVNPNTTAALVIENGNIRTVPAYVNGTQVVIRSLTNSAYAVVESSKTFKDVNNGKSWAEEYIEVLSSKMIINGKTKDSYAPNAYMTRGEFAALISRSLGLTPSKPYNGEFSDVTGKEAVNKNGEIMAAFEAGIIQGKQDGRFAPNDHITRAEAAVMVARAMEYVGYDSTKLNPSKGIKQFKDQKVMADWSKNGIDLVAQADIMNGMGGGVFAPTEDTKRDQMAKMLANFLRFVGFMN